MLTGEEVTKRTDTVIKMAQVTGDAVEEVSSYMTAVWNNFDNGSKSLEYYADVIAQLGAKTAASSSEISQGLEKFAAVAETAGLSYEYATSALATVVATTRQSADTVGTAFKTLFARIQDLELGKTLDDGTTLGKYAQALESVGVNIKDVNGDLKNMDIILDELGARWETLGNDVQVAVAQAIGGTRQYNQLMSLMENWDTMKQNVEYAREAEGTVQRQADIYAESWEAAQKRIRAASQEIYDSLIDEKFFISVDDTITKLLKGTAGLIQNLGGVQGVISTLAAFILSKFNGEIATGIDNLIIKFKDAKQDADSIRTNAVNLATEGLRQTGTKESDKVEYEALKERLNLQLQFIQNSKKMSEIEQSTFRYGLDNLTVLKDKAVEQQKIAEAKREEYDASLKLAQSNAATPIENDNYYVKQLVDDLNSIQDEIDRLESINSQKVKGQVFDNSTIQNMAKQLPNDQDWQRANEAIQENQQKIQELKKELQEKIPVDNIEKYLEWMKEAANDAEKAVKDTFSKLSSEMQKATRLDIFKKDILNLPKDIDKDSINQIKEVFKNIEGFTPEQLTKVFGKDVTAEISLFNTELNKTTINYEKLQNIAKAFASISIGDFDFRNPAIEDFTNKMKILGSSQSDIDKYIEKIQNAATEEERAKVVTEALTTQTEALRKKLEDINNQPISIGQKIASSVQALSSLSMALNTISGSMKTLSGDASALQKVSALLMLLGTTIRTVTTITTTSSVIFNKNTKAKQNNTVATNANTTANNLNKNSISAVSTALGAVTAVLMVGTILYEQYANAIEKTNQQKIKDAELTQQQKEKDIEELNAKKELYSAYKEALNVYLASGEQKLDLIDKANKVAEAYNIEGAAIAILTNNYEKLNAELDKADIALNNKIIKEAQAEQTAILNQIKSSQDNQSSNPIKEIGAVLSDLPGLIKRSVIEFGTKSVLQFGTEWNNVETDVSGIDIYQNLIDEAARINAKFGGQEVVAVSPGGKITAQVQGNAYEQYAQLQEIQNSSLQEIRASIQEDQDKIEELKTAIQTELTPTVNNITKQITDDITLDDFIEIRENGLKELKKFGEEGANALKAAFRTTNNQSFLYETLISGFEEHANWKPIYEEIQDFVDNSALFIDFVNFFPNLTVEQAKEIWKKWAAVFEASQEFTTLELRNVQISVGIKDIKENMGPEDYKKLYEDTVNLNWTNSSKQYFETLTQDQQKRYLEQFKTDNNDLYLMLQAILNGYIEQRNSLLEDIAKASSAEEINNFNKALTETDNKIASVYQDLHKIINQSTEESINQLKTFRDEIDKIKIGDTISSDTASYLQSLGVNIEKYLVDIGDGTFRLVNAAEEFVKVTKEASYTKEIDQQYNNIQKFNNNLQRYQDLIENDDILTIANPDYVSYQEELKKLQRQEWEASSRFAQASANYSVGTPEFAALSDEERRARGQELIDAGDEYDKLSKELEDLEEKGASIIETITINKNEEYLEAVKQAILGNLEALHIEIEAEYEQFSEEWFEQAVALISESSSNLFQEYANSFTNLNDLDLGFSNYLNEQYPEAIKAYAIAWESLNEQMELTNVDTQKLAEYTEHLLDIADDVDQDLLSRFLDEDTANNIAKEVLRMNAGLEALTSNFEKWNDVLQNSSKTSQEYAAALNGLRAAAADLFDVNEDFISSEFLVDPDNLTAFQEAMNGSEEAIDSLKVKLTESIVQGFDITGELKSGLNRAIADIQQDLATLKIGGEIDPTLLAGLEKAAKEAKLTATEFEALADAMGIDVDYEQQTITGPVQGTRIHHQVKSYETVDDRTGAANYVEDEWSEPVTLDEVEHTVFAFGTNGEKPSIKGATKKATGVMANNSSLNKGGNVSSPKKPVKGDKSQFKTEVERYHEINKVLEDMERKLKRIENVKSKAFGPDKIKAIKDEVGMLNAENKAYEERLREANEYLQMDRAKVLGLGAQIDENGIITNYSQVAASLNNQYNQGYVEYINAQNAAIAAYSQTGNQDAYDKALDAINEKWKAVQQLNKENVDALKQYEDTIKQIEEDETKQLELKQQIRELALEEIQVKVDLKLELNEREVKLLQRQIELLGKGLNTATDRIEKYAKTAESAIKASNGSKQGIEELLSNAGITQSVIAKYFNSELSESELEQLVNSLTEDEFEELKTLTDKIGDSAKEIEETFVNVLEEIRNAFDTYEKQFDKFENRFSSLSKFLDNINNTINLVGAQKLDPTGQLRQMLANTQVEVAQGELDTSKIKLQGLKDRLADLEEASLLEEISGNEQLKEKNEEDIEEIKQLILDAEGEVSDNAYNLLEQLHNQVTKNIEISIEQWEKAISGSAGNLDNLQAIFDMRKDVADDTVADYRRIYELTKLTRDITESINDSTNIKNNERLAALQERITAEMESQEASSEYTLENYRREYELLLAQAQLEDARNNKTSLKLKRDSQGNYSYQYGVDEDAINDALQNYEDKLYALQKANDDRQQELQEGIIALDAWYAEQVSHFDEYDQARQEEITRTYNERLKRLTSELERVINNNSSLYNNEWTNYSKMTGYKISADKDYIDSWNELQLASITGFTSLDKYMDAHVTAAETMVQKVGGYLADYDAEIQNQIGTQEQYAQSTTVTMQSISDDVKATTEEVNRFSENFEEKFALAVEAAQNFANKYSGAMNIVETVSQTVQSNLNNVLTEAIKLTEGINGIPADFTRNYKLVYNIVTNGSAPDFANFDDLGGNNPAKSPEEVEGNRYTIVSGATKEVLGVAVSHADLVKQLNNINQNGENIAHRNGGYIIRNINTGGILTIPWVAQLYNEDWLNKLYPNAYSKFDTGGYTGNWNSSEGRLAMLHQKELVLNASDTNNMLEMVSAVRDLAGAAQANVAGNIAQMIADNIASALYNTTTINNGMQQQVTINADFPAATSAYEIETALNSLVNKATQRAGISQNYR